MESIAKNEPQTLEEGDTKLVTILLSDRLWRRVKVAAAANGLTLRALVKDALEQYLDTKAEAA